MLGRRRQFHDPKADSSAIGLSLINLLSDLAIEPRMKASVNKDRIYALLGMANDTELLGIHPDYSESTSCESAYIIAGTGLDGVTLKGYLVDVIEDLVPGWTPRDDPMKDGLPQLGKYLESIRNLCDRSNAKAWVNIVEIYTKASDRADAHIRIPIADHEMNTDQFGIGGLQGATALSQRTYASLLEHIEGKLKPPADAAALKDVTCYNLCMSDQLFRKPFLAKKAYVGLVPNHSKVVDVLIIFRGGKFPSVVRGNGDGTYRFIGDAYVHGIMYGQFTEKELVLMNSF